MTDEELINLTRNAGWNGICMELVGPTQKKSIFTPTTIEQIRCFVELVVRARRITERTKDLGSGE
jgi:hypothetical protein